MGETLLIMGGYKSLGLIFAALRAGTCIAHLASSAVGRTEEGGGQGRQSGAGGRGGTGREEGQEARGAGQMKAGISRADPTD